MPYTVPAEAEVLASIPDVSEAVRREATSALPTAEAFKLETVSTASLFAALSAVPPRPASAEEPVEAACTPARALAETEAAEQNAEPEVREEAQYVTALVFEEVTCFLLKAYMLAL